MQLTYFLPMFAALVLALPCSAQDDGLLALDAQYPLGDAGADPAPDLMAYERLTKALGGDSLRLCNGFPCSGWVVDNHAGGAVKHRGYYDNGKLVTYRNQYPDGTVEREFKEQGSVKSVLRTYHPNGNLRSETRYENGTALAYQDHYVNGVLRYREERHRKRPYFTLMELYDGHGRPISLLRSSDAKREEFEQQEYHPGGQLKSEGRARYNPKRMDTQRIGTWMHYDADGSLLAEEQYIDGKVHR